MDTADTRKKLRALDPSITEQECREVISYITAMDVPDEDHYGANLAMRLKRYRMLQYMAGGDSVWDHLIIGLERWRPTAGSDENSILRTGQTLVASIDDEDLRRAVNMSNSIKRKFGIGYKPGAGAWVYTRRILNSALRGM